MTNADGHDWYTVYAQGAYHAHEYECQRCGMRQPLKNIGCNPPCYGPCTGTRQQTLELEAPPLA